MGELNQIIPITITSQTTAVSITGFGVPAVIAKFADDAVNGIFERTRTYTSLAGLVADGWATTDEVYKTANAIFSQTPTVQRIIVGRIAPTGETIADGLNAINNENSDFYGFAYVSIVASGATAGNPVAQATADITACSTWAEANSKIFFYSSNVEAIYSNAGSTTLPAMFMSSSRRRTFGIFNEHAQEDITNREYAEFAEMGKALAYDAGSVTHDFKTLSGVSVSPLTASQKTQIHNKNMATFTRIGGVNITQNVVSASGEYLDIVRGQDWVTARLQEAVFSELVNRGKLGYVDEDLVIIESAMRGVFNAGVTRRYIQDDSIVITLPTIPSISATNKRNRILPDVRFSFALVGAYHTVQINGVITV